MSGEMTSLFKLKKRVYFKYQTKHIQNHVVVFLFLSFFLFFLQYNFFSFTENRIILIFRVRLLLGNKSYTE